MVGRTADCASTTEVLVAEALLLVTETTVGCGSVDKVLDAAVVLLKIGVSFDELMVLDVTTLFDDSISGTGVATEGLGATELWPGAVAATTFETLNAYVDSGREDVEDRME